MASIGFIGAIAPIKASDKFKPYTEITNEKGTTKIYKFSARCGVDQHIIQFTAWTPADGSHRDIKAKKRDKSGKLVNYDIKWADRNKSSVLATADEISKYIVDINPSGRVAELEHLVEAFNDGSITDEKMNKFKVKSVEEAQKLLTEAKEGRHECLAPADFIEILKDFVESNPEGKFYIQGDYELSQSKGNWYSAIKVRKITRFIDKEDEDVTASTLNLKMYITPESIDNEPDDRLVVTGYVPVYAGRKDDGTFKYDYAPVSVVSYKTAENTKKIDKMIELIGYTTDDDETISKEIGFKCRIHNGSERVKLTYEMLSDEQKELVDLELMSIADIEKEMNKDLYGEKKTDIEILGFMKGYSGGSQASSLTVDEVLGNVEEPDELSDDIGIEGL